jgi:tetratricopeptide (TPR) repeat protein
LADNPRPASPLAVNEQGLLANAAIEHHLAGRLSDAIFCYAAAHARAPLAFGLVLNWSIALQQSGRTAEALQVCDVALALNPQSAPAHGHRADILLGSGDAARSLDSYRRALSIDPAFLPALRNLADAAIRLGLLSEAEEALSRAGDLDPTSAMLLSDLSGVRHQLGMFEAALTAADRAIDLDPGTVPAHYNRGLALESLRRYDEALACFDRVRTLDPAHVEARWNSALIHLRCGRHDRGWPLYEARKERTGFDRDHIARRALRPWRGPGDRSDAGLINAGRLLVLSEQGLGDTLQFCRFVSLLPGLGIRPTLVVQDPLVTLIGRSLDLPVVSRDRLPDLSGYDYHADLLSLPGLLEGLATPPWLDAKPYLVADEARVATWRHRLADLSQPRIGLMWRGRRNPMLAERSVPAGELFAALPKHATFFTLQQSVTLEEIALARSAALEVQVTQHLDFEDAAALITNLDRVVSIDTSIAHLSGALGQETWLVIPENCDWRWGTGNDNSAYSNLRLFQSHSSASWSDVLGQLTEALNERSGA